MRRLKPSLPTPSSKQPCPPVMRGKRNSGTRPLSNQYMLLNLKGILQRWLRMLHNLCHRALLTRKQRHEQKSEEGFRASCSIPKINQLSTQQLEAKRDAEAPCHGSSSKKDGFSLLKNLSRSWPSWPSWHHLFVGTFSNLSVLKLSHGK